MDLVHGRGAQYNVKPLAYSTLRRDRGGLFILHFVGPERDCFAAAVSSYASSLLASVRAACESKMLNQTERFRSAFLSIGDNVGAVFIGETKIIRAINARAIPDTHELLQSGLIAELVQRGLFPKTKISDAEVPGYALVLEHEKIDPIIYPFEWSPEMLRRAALCILKVNACANKYGYELKDAHPYNVVFKFGTPVFVDFGSIVKRRAEAVWCAHDEFNDSYYLPLRLYERGLVKVFRHVFLLNGRGVSGSELAVITSPVFSIIGLTATRNLLRLKSIYQRGTAITEDVVGRRIKNPFARKLVKLVLGYERLPFRKHDMASLEKRINSLRLARVNTVWGNYHSRSGFYSDDGSIRLTPRMSWVKETVGRLKPRTVIELAGNQGVLSRELAKLPNVERVVCTDYDESSVDELLLRSKGDERVFMGCFDFMSDVWAPADRTSRLRSEMAIALAVTHHLVLAQKYAISAIFRTLASYTSKYLIVEFMPLGLWDGEKAPALPKWYNEEWFVENLEKYFDILERVELEHNRVAFLGSLKSTNSAMSVAL